MSEIKKIDKFTFSLKDTIGQGSFGTVYKGRDVETGEEVAIKMLNKHMIQTDEYMLNGFFQEIKVMKKLKSPCVVQLHDVLETNNNYYIVQDFCEGGDLGKMLKKKKKFSQNESVIVLKDILTGFMELLQHGIIHRDLKPENILIGKGVYKLADFGFARTVQNFNNQMLQSVVGTPLYMSPQILRHEEYTTKSDIWSMALIFYELMFGRTPWNARSQMELINNILNQKIEFPESIAVISEQAKQFIIHCLKIEESERISWDQIYCHPLFEGHFDKLMKQTVHIVDREKFIANTIRQRVNTQNSSLDELFFKKFSFKMETQLTLKDLSQVLVSILSKPLSEEDIFFLFQKLATNGSSYIVFASFYNWLQMHQCRMGSSNEFSIENGNNLNKINQLQETGHENHREKSYSHSSLNNSVLEQKATETINKLIYAINKFHVEIKKLYKKFDKSQNEQMEITNFGNMVKRIDKDLKDDEIKAAFDKFDSLKIGYITFQQFNDTLQVLSHQIQQQVGSTGSSHQ